MSTSPREGNAGCGIAAAAARPGGWTGLLRRSRGAASGAEREPDERRRAAFAALWDRERPLLRRTIVRIIGTTDHVDDLVQETAVRALEAFSSFRGDSGHGTWLYRIAVNVALRHREQRARIAGPPPADHVAADPAESPEQRALAADRAPRIWAALDSLPDDLRTPLLLHVYEELKYREIAAALEIPIGTVMSRLHTARQRLKVALRKELDDEL